MSVRFWNQLSALRNLSAASIQLEADQPFSIGIVGRSHELNAWQQVLIPPEVSERKRDQALKRLFTITSPLSDGYRHMLPQFDVLLTTPAAADEVRGIRRDYLLLPATPGSDRRWAESLTSELWESHYRLRFALARHYVPLRDPVVSRVISAVALENAAFAILTALPDVIPNPFELPWAVGEFASDTAVITANQARMAFMIAAASDSAVGWREQKAQLASIAGAAFGWRALARELSGKLPGGTGLIAKGLIAYAGTVAVGRGLAQFHRVGRHFTRAEKRQAYDEAFRTGRARVEDLTRKLRGAGGRQRRAVADGAEPMGD